MPDAADQWWFLIRGQYRTGDPEPARRYLATQPPAVRRQFAVHGFEAVVRQGALQAIAADAGPDELAWLRTRAELDPDPDVRVTALQAVLRGDPGVLGWLRGRATDQHADVRRAAVEAIAQRWPDDPETPEWLRARCFDPDEDVRAAAVVALAHDLDWVRERARDLSPKVRLAALEAVAADPDGLPWLRARTRDQDGGVRMAAVRAIATGWADDPATLPWLLARATRRPQDSIPLLRPEDTYDSWAGPDDDVRVAAIQAITAGWAGDPAVRERLPDWAGDQHPAARAAAAAASAGSLIGKPESSNRNQPYSWPVPDTLDGLRAQAADTSAPAPARMAAISHLAADDTLLRDLATRLPESGSAAQQAVAAYAIQQVAIGRPADPDTLALLRGVLHDPPVGGTTRLTGLAAVRALTVLRPGDGPHPRLRDLAAEPTSWAAEDHVAPAAIALLVAAYRDDPATLPLLKRLMLYRHSRRSGPAAVRALTAGWRADPATLPVLHEVVRSALAGSASDAAGEAALEEIVAGWPGDGGTLSLLRDCATDPDRNWSVVRNTALQLLAAGWPQEPHHGVPVRRSDRWTAARAAIVAHPESFDIALAGTTHLSYDVRCAALTAIATAWPDDPRTLPLLLRACFDGHEWVEALALNALAAGWPDHPQTLPLLRYRAADEEYTEEDTRMAALMAFVAIGPDDPETLAWLSRLVPEVQRASIDRHRTTQS